MTPEELVQVLEREKATYTLNAAISNQAMLAALLDSQAHLLSVALGTSYEGAKQGLNDLVESSRQKLIEAAEIHLERTRILNS